MTKLKKVYNYSRGRQIWRLLPTGTNKLIVEERDTSTKEVFFNCIDINSGKKIFYDFQLDEKYWTGIETIYNDIIIFHKYASRDMPEHYEMIAFDINSKKIIWQNNEYIFLFIRENKIYCYKNKFEGREFFIVDYRTGNLQESLGDDANRVNLLRVNSFNLVNTGSFLFPEPFCRESMNDQDTGKYFEQYKTKNTIAGKIEFIKAEDIILFNCHNVLPDGSLKNIFTAFEFSSKKVILEKILNCRTEIFIPDCFFTKDGLLFLLIEKIKFKVYSIKK
ncbi:MAG: DUF4905 domain-containing protein [Ignavibacteriaceae bacterium]|jgi:hypothetical protein